jgi:hypothetical protein
MSGEVYEFPPALAAALVQAQKTVGAVEKAGFNKQINKHYATADDIAAASKAALNDAGAALVRVGNDLDAGRLADYELGAMGYAGDVIDHWLLVHESGEAYKFSTRTGVIVQRGRPHDKGAAASMTYASGVVARGLLAMEREEPGNGVDSREDQDSGEPIRRRQGAGRSGGGRKRDAVGARCRGRAAAKADKLRGQIQEIAKIEQCGPGVVWERLLETAKIEMAPYLDADSKVPESESDLGVKDADAMIREASHWLTELSNG